MSTARFIVFFCVRLQLCMGLHRSCNGHWNIPIGQDQANVGNVKHLSNGQGVQKRTAPSRRKECYPLTELQGCHPKTGFICSCGITQSIWLSVIKPASALLFAVHNWTQLKEAEKHKTCRPFDNKTQAVWLEKLRTRVVHSLRLVRMI